jgi:hypothetical protein
MADQWASREELAGLREQVKGNLGIELVTKALELKRISREVNYRKKKEMYRLKSLFDNELKRLKQDIDTSMQAAKVLLSKAVYKEVLDKMLEIEDQLPEAEAELTAASEEPAEPLQSVPEEVAGQDTEERKDKFLDKVEDFMSKVDPLAKEPEKEESLNTADNYDNQEEEEQGG